MTATTQEPQNMRALARANEVRLARAALKGEVGTGATSVATALDHWAAKSMRVYDLLGAQHGWGRARVLRALRRAEVLEFRAVGSLTVRERLALLVEVGELLEPSSPPVPAPEVVPEVHEVTFGRRMPIHLTANFIETLCGRDLPGWTFGPDGGSACRMCAKSRRRRGW